MAYALILNNRVIQIANETFPVSKSLAWVEISAEAAKMGDIYHNHDGTFTKPPEIKPVYMTDPIATLLLNLGDYCMGTIDKDSLKDAIDGAQESLGKMVIRIN